MKLSIITDSTCDLPLQELNELGVRRVSLTVTFKGKNWRDWEEITPRDIIEGVAGGADLPTTSQPSPEAFAQEYRAAVDSGATEILVLTISSEVSGTYQSAMLARQEVDIPVTVFDTRAASAGLAHVVRRAAELRDDGLEVAAMMPELESVRDSNFVMFSVGTLEYLQKGGRIGAARALIGGLLNIKPLLSLDDGKIVPAGRARGTKKAVEEIVARIVEHGRKQDGELYLTFLHVQDPAAAQQLKEAVDHAGLRYRGGMSYEIGAVIAAHVGPGTRAIYMYTRPNSAAARAQAEAAVAEPVASA